jgi:hypothetical protein
VSSSRRPPSGPGWVHEVKFDGYRMAARINHGNVQLLTRSGLDWTEKYPETADALAKLPVATAYIDGELCGVRDDGVTSFKLIQQATDRGTGALVYFPFDLLELDGASTAKLPLTERKGELARILKKAPAGVSYSSHFDDDGEALRLAACKQGLEALFPSGPTRLIRRVIEAYGSRAIASTERSSSSSDGLSRKARAHSSARCFLATTRRMAAFSMPVGSERGCQRRRCACCTAASRRWRQPRCLSPRRRHARRGSAERWRCRRSIGRSPSLSRKSPLSPG